MSGNTIYPNDELITQTQELINTIVDKKTAIDIAISDNHTFIKLNIIKMRRKTKPVYKHKSRNARKLEYIDKKLDIIEEAVDTYLYFERKRKEMSSELDEVNALLNNARALNSISKISSNSNSNSNTNSNDERHIGTSVYKRVKYSGVSDISDDEDITETYNLSESNTNLTPIEIGIRDIRKQVEIEEEKSSSEVYMYNA